jgi:hypothetical protein
MDTIIPKVVNDTNKVRLHAQTSVHNTVDSSDENMTYDEYMQSKNKRQKT